MTAAAPMRLEDLAHGHWLVFEGGQRSRIFGCFCGFTANLVDYDYGDEVVAHIVTVALGLREMTA